MPPKRTTLPENLSPPPSQGSITSMDHHHSPAAGYLPEMPVDAAIASASPQSKRFKENDMPPIPSSPNQSPETPGEQQEPTDLLTSPTTAAVVRAPVLSPSLSTNGGARAAYIAAQQHRVVTCNLSLIPPSKSAATQLYGLTRQYRRPTKNPLDWHHHRYVHPTIRTSGPHVHVGGGQGWRRRSDCMGRYCQPANGHIGYHWKSSQHSRLFHEFL
jgi:hypothetical protein